MGRVLVDGEPAHLGQKVDPAEATVLIDHVPLPIKPGLVHFLVYKPTGVVSTADDPQGRTTVIDLVPSGTRVYPVGRLDRDSEGLIIVTNDGDLTKVLTHPSHQVPKTYVARVRGRVVEADIRQLLGGVRLEDGPAAAQEASIIDSLDGETLVELVMTEGRNREVRRMFDSLGHQVVGLVRTAIGPLRDRSLKPGAWRRLTVEEVRGLYGAGARR